MADRRSVPVPQLRSMIRLLGDGEMTPIAKRQLESLCAEPPIPDNLCFRCGKSDTENEEDGFGPLVDVSVMVANGAEGFAHVLRYVCNQHLIAVTDAFRGLGFVSHRHGGINFLEPLDCPGRGDPRACPSPEEED